jgi:serine/threonine protein kinase
MAFEAQRHSFRALQQTFIVDQDYTFHKELGQGAYGLVVAAKNRRTGEGCAIKKITNIGTKVCSSLRGLARPSAALDVVSIWVADHLNAENPHQKMSQRNQVSI